MRDIPKYVEFMKPAPSILVLSGFYVHDIADIENVAKDVGLVHGQFETFKFHMMALVIVGVFTFGGSYLIFKITGLITKLRVSPEDELIGLDISQHSETMRTSSKIETLSS